MRAIVTLLVLGALGISVGCDSGTKPIPPKPATETPATTETAPVDPAE